MRTSSPPFRAAGVALAPPGPSVGPDEAFAARPRLARLRDALAARPARRPRWGEPAVFFFDGRRQAELDAARPPAPATAPHPLETLIAAELPTLFRSVEVRRVARAVPGLRDAAAARAADLPVAKDLADLLVMPDDEAVVVLHPETQTGFRLLVRGVADLRQFLLLLPDAAAGGWDAATAAGEPLVAEARFRLFTPAALRVDGSLPVGFAGCDHWLWGTQSLAAVPRVGGERTVLLGEPAFRETWDVVRRFPALPAAVRVLQPFRPAEVADRLGRLVGRPVPVRAAVRIEQMLAEAA